MAYVPSNSDATPFSSDMVARLVLAGASVSTRDTIVALCDAILRSTGYQAFNEATGLGAANNGASTGFSPVGNLITTGYSNYMFSAPVAKTYLVRAHVCFFCSVLAAGDFVGWQLQNLTIGATAPNSTAAIFPSAANQRIRATFDFPIAMQAGNNVIQLQWRSGSAGTTANVTTGDYRVFAITG